MRLNKEKLRAKVDRQTARDHARMRQWACRREERFLKSSTAPLAAQLGRVGVIGMAAGTLLCVTGDLANALRFGHAASLAAHRACVSGFACWAAFSLIVIPCMLLQLRRGFGDPYYERYRYDRKGRMLRSPEKRCRMWLRIAIAGACALGLAALVTA